MSILVSKKDRAELKSTCTAAALCSLFCFIFSRIYYQFSHGVHSPYMTFLFAWPLLLCVVPAGICFLSQRVPGPSMASSLFWHTGTAAVTVSSLLRGIFDIAGNSSVYQTAMMIAGFVFLGAGLLFYVSGLFLRCRTD